MHTTTEMYTTESARAKSHTRVDERLSKNTDKSVEGEDGNFTDLCFEYIYLLFHIGHNVLLPNCTGFHLYYSIVYFIRSGEKDPCHPDCHIDIAGWSDDDMTFFNKSSYVKLNNRIAFSYECVYGLGMTLIVVDPVRCVAKEKHTWRTELHASEGNALKDFIIQLEPETAVVVISGDNPRP